MVAIQIVTTPDYKGPKILVVDRVPVYQEAVNCVGGFLFVTNG